MATAAEILEVRNNTNTTISDYSNIIIEELIDNSSVKCASATIWKWELSKLGKDAAKGIKQSSTGVESHTFNSIKDQMDYYKFMFEFWKEECEESKGTHTSAFVKAEPKSVAGVITEDQINELIDP